MLRNAGFRVEVRQQTSKIYWDLRWAVSGKETRVALEQRARENKGPNQWQTDY